MKRTIDIATGYRMFTVTYQPATDTRPSAVKIIDTRHKKSVRIPYCYECSSAGEVAVNYLESIGITIHALALGHNESHPLTTDFETPLR